MAWTSAGVRLNEDVQFGSGARHASRALLLCGHGVVQEKERLPFGDQRTSVR